MTDADLNELYDNRSDPDVRMVLEDWERSQGWTPTRIGYAIFCDAAAADAADDDAADDDAADAADAAADDADADADAADDAADAADAAARRATQIFLEEPLMERGLCLVQIAITYYRAITFVGWARRKSGDEWELVPGARIVTRTKGKPDWNGFDDLASSGLGDSYRVRPAMKQPEPLHRLLIKRCKPANEKAWAEHCPKPKDWSE